MRVLNIHGVGDFRLDPKVPPTAGADDAVIKIKACGICGSDLSYIKWGGINRAPDGVTPIGHEAAGEIVAVGRNVKDLAVGQRVIINPMNTPSFIGSGGPEGAFSDEVLVTQAKAGDNLIAIPPGIPYDIAALTEPLAVAMHGVNRSKAKAGDKIVVFGCGPIGLGMLLWLLDRGVTDVVAVDLSDDRLARAKALGVTKVINAKSENLKERLSVLHGTHVYFGRDVVNTDAFIDAAGGPTIVSDVINICKLHARLVITAAYTKPVEISLGMMLTSELEMTTAVGYPTEMPDVIAAMPRLQGKLASLISHRFSFDDIMDGFKVAATPESAKVMIEFAEDLV